MSKEHYRWLRAWTVTGHPKFQSEEKRAGVLELWDTLRRRLCPELWGTIKKSRNTEKQLRSL